MPEYHFGPVAVAAHQSRARLKYVWGSIGTAKSTWLVWRVFFKAVQASKLGVSLRAVIMRDTYRNLSDSTLKTWLRWFPDNSMMGYISKSNPADYMLRTPDGRMHEVLFRHGQTAQDASMFLSTEYGFIGLEEVAPAYLPGVEQRVSPGISEEVFDLAYSRLRQEGLEQPEIALTSNPPSRSHWASKRIIDKSGDERHGTMVFNLPGIAPVTWEHWFTPTSENQANLRPGYYEELTATWPRILVRRFVEGERVDMFIGTPRFNLDQLDDLKKLATVPSFQGLLPSTDENLLHVKLEEKAGGYVKMWAPPDLRHRYVIGCLPDGEQVLTRDGWKEIEAVGLDDLLYDIDGTETGIKSIQRRPYDGPIHSIKVQGFIDPVRLTPEHPVWTVDGVRTEQRVSNGDRRRKKPSFCSWKEAQTVNAGDFVRIPLPFQQEVDIDPSRWPSQSEVRVDRVIDSSILKDGDFWWFVGLYLADGYSWKARISDPRKGDYGYQVAVALNLKVDKPVADRAARLIARLFNRSPQYTEKENVIEVKFTCESMYRFLQQFGRGAANKRVPPWVKTIPKPLRIEFFRGYFDGDGGTVRSRNHVAGACVSISKGLINDFQDILLSCGMFTGVSKLRDEGVCSFPGKDKEYKQKAAFQMRISTTAMAAIFDGHPVGRSNSTYAWIDGKYLFVKVAKNEVSQYVGCVNNFETSSHSYLARYLAVHNCDVAEGVEGGDYSAAYVLDCADASIAAAWHGHMEPALFSEELTKLGNLYNRANVCVENNAGGHGNLVLHKLSRDLGYPHIYTHQPADIRNPQQNRLGMRTDQRTKPMLVNLVGEYLESLGSKGEHGSINDKDLIAELQTFGIMENGRCEAQDGCFDDRVIAFSLALLVQQRSGLNRIFPSAGVQHAF
jgi:hypothetical protein